MRGAGFRQQRRGVVRFLRARVLFVGQLVVERPGSFLLEVQAVVELLVFFSDGVQKLSICVGDVQALGGPLAERLAGVLVTSFLHLRRKRIL